jgi:predicted AlkP superfamily phosphohydrolase/phosphomutase
MKKMMIIGIDGMDYHVVQEHLDKLPNIAKLMDKNGRSCMRSVFPPDTTPAWATIYTGLDPSEHGIINFVNVKDKENQYQSLVIEDSSFKGQTFWDKCSKAGLRSVVLLPININPGWQINGLMIARGEQETTVWPGDRKDFFSPDSRLLSLDGKFYSNSQLAGLLEQLKAKLDEEYRIAHLAIQNEEWDLLFAYFSTLDAVQHTFWKYCDINHPEYPGKNAYSSAIIDMYVRMDAYIGDLLLTPGDIATIILSDHGHGARPVYVARINEMLRREGLLFPAQAQKNRSNISLKSNIKKFLIKSTKKYGIPNVVVKLARKYPLWKNLFASSADFDFNKTVAYLSDLSAIKNYSFGGIRINSTVENKGEATDKVLHALKDIEIEGENKKAFIWIGKREELYQGRNIDRYPEILFQLDERYGADWELGENLFEKKGFMHELSPGSHRWLSAVIFSNNFKLPDTVELTDISPIICKYFDINN